MNSLPELSLPFPGMKAFLLFLLGVLCACQRTLAPAAYLMVPPVKGRVLIPMDGAIEITFTAARLDSPSLVHNVLSQALKDGRNRVEMVVYFNGGGPGDIHQAGAAGYRLKTLLVSQGYPEARLQSSYKFYIPPASVQRYPYRKVDFIITRMPKGSFRK